MKTITAIPDTEIIDAIQKLADEMRLEKIRIKDEKDTSNFIYEVIEEISLIVTDLNPEHGHRRISQKDGEISFHTGVRENDDGNLEIIHNKKG